jgi:hypothetical protein
MTESGKISTVPQIKLPAPDFKSQARGNFMNIMLIHGSWHGACAGANYSGSDDAALYTTDAGQSGEFGASKEDGGKHCMCVSNEDRS